MPGPNRLRGQAERGAAIADFALVSGLVTVLFVVVFQLGFALHVRNTVISCASEGARLGARADASPADGVARTRELIGSSLSARYAESVGADVEAVDGVQVVVVRVSAPLPVLGPWGPGGRLHLVGRAFLERQ